MIALSAVLLDSDPAQAQTPRGIITGRITDQETLAPISNMVIRIEGTRLATVTDEDGEFTLPGVRAGDRVLVMAHLAYGEHTRTVTVLEDQMIRVNAVVGSEAIELEPVTVVVPSELEQRRRSTGFGINEVDEDEISEAARRGLDLPSLMQQGMPGIRVRGTCVEYRGIGSRAGTPCREVAVYLDGVPVSSPSMLYPTLPLEDIARMEILSPVQASTRYGGSAGWGALLIETKRGPQRARVSNTENLMSGFDWSEEAEPYPWARVFGSAFIGNALGLGIGMLMVSQCLRVSDTGFAGLRTDCAAPFTVGSGVVGLGLPTITGSYAARWAGSTERSRGRLTPSAFMAALAVTGGYLLLVDGDTRDSKPTEIAGATILVIGTPLIHAFADRVFRFIR